MILGEVAALIIIYGASVLGIVFGIINACIVNRISMFHNDSNLSSRQSLSNDTLIDKIPQMEEIAELIARVSLFLSLRDPGPSCELSTNASSSSLFSSLSSLRYICYQS